MKRIIIAMLILGSVNFGHARMEKDRGGGEVPYAQGLSAVSLSWDYSQSLVTITGDSARLLFESLKVEASNNNPFAKVDQITKEKDNVTCTKLSSYPGYECAIRISN